MKAKIKISDIARECGVSVSTVSLAINNKPGVSDETRDRVLQAARQLGYPIQPSPASLKCHPLTTIGMVVKTDPDIAPQANPFYSKVIVGIEDGCRRNGINLLFATLPVDEDNRPLEAPSLLTSNLVEGLLLVGAFVDGTITALAKTGRGGSRIPIVLVDGYSDTESFDAVLSNNFRAAYQAVEYLIHRGHRHIGLVGSEPDCYPSLKERRNGYLRALKDHGIRDTYIAGFNLTRTKGYAETTRLLKEHPNLSALFCVNDDLAGAAIRAVHDLGKRVPADVSVIGYDDTYIAANTIPALTTMHVDTVAMGRSAVQLLALRAENPDAARMTLTIHPWMVERESVSAA